MKKLILLILALLPLGSFAYDVSDLNTTEDIKIIGCINQITLETRKPVNGTCYYGYGWQNIMLPPSSHWAIWQDIFKGDAQILNRLPIVNFESGFNPMAGNKYAIGYVQTLRRYNIQPDIETQLKWLYTRQESQKQGNCSHWWEYGTDRVMRCLYARHYGARNGDHWYPNKAMAAREYYYDYFLNNN